MSLSPNTARNGNHTPPPTTYRRLSLKRNILWTGIGTAIYYVAQYALLSLLAKLTNSSAVGQFALGLAITTPIITFSQMQFRSLQVTDVKNEYSFQEYFWTRFYGTLLALLVITVMAFAGSYSTESRTVILVFGLAKAFESLSDLTYGTLQSRDRMDYVAISQIVKSLFSILLFGSVLYFTRQFLPALICMAVVWAIVFFALDLPFACKISGAKSLFVFPSTQVMRQLVTLSLPLAINATINAYLLNMPRYTLEHIYSSKEVGYFSAVASLVGLITLLTGTVSQATLARATHYYQSGQAKLFLKLTLQMTVLQVGVGLIASLGIFLVGVDLIEMLYTAEYRQYTSTLLLMTLGMSFGGLAVIGVTIVTAARMFKLQMIYMVGVLLVQIVANKILISRYGVLGAGWSELCKFVTVTLFVNILTLPILLRLWRAAKTHEENPT